MVMRVKLEAKQQRQIMKDLHSCVSNMTQERPKVLSRIVGPLVISVWYEVLSGRCDYRITASVHNLASESDHIYASLGIDSDPETLTWNKHERGYYKKIMDLLKERSPLPLEGPVTLSMVPEACKKYVIEYPRAYFDFLLETPSLVAAWAGQKERALEGIEWSVSVLKTWSENLQAEHGGLEGWRQKMLQEISDPERLRAIVDQEIIKHKLTKIPREELIVD